VFWNVSQSQDVLLPDSTGIDWWQCARPDREHAASTFIPCQAEWSIGSAAEEQSPPNDGLEGMFFESVCLIMLDQKSIYHFESLGMRFCVSSYLAYES